MAATLSEQIGLVEIAPDKFVSKCVPARMGNQLPIAYGGCTMGVGVHAAALTVGPAYNLYSLLGHFLGPAMTDRNLSVLVHRLRDTRTFATRRVEVFQELADGDTRLCMTLEADFHIREPSMVEYSSPPLTQYSDPDSCPSTDKLGADLIAKGYISPDKAKAFLSTFNMMGRFFDNRLCPEGIWGQNLGGLAKDFPTTQDHLPITSKTSGDWFRAVQSSLTKAENYAGLAFIMDAGPSFMPLIHDHKSMWDAGACSSLDFALRIFEPDLDITKWHLRERRTITAHAARNYAESQLWDGDGKMVASMTQHTIIRPPKGWVMKPVKAAL